MTQLDNKRSQMTAPRAKDKIITMCLVGIAVGIGATVVGQWQFALLAAWDAAALTYCTWTMLTVLTMNSSDTERHAIRDDPSRKAARVFIILVCIGSLAAVGLMLAEAHTVTGLAQLAGITFAIVSVVVSWLTLHLLYMLRYAELYYLRPVGGIDFLDTRAPSYRDFMYLAFTLGMTFQVSDTSLRTSQLRRVALGQALLSYVFGTVIVAATVNLVASLG